MSAETIPHGIKCIIIIIIIMIIIIIIIINIINITMGTWLLNYYQLSCVMVATLMIRAGLTIKQNNHVLRASREGEIYFIVYYCLYFELHRYMGSPKSFKFL